jgi:ankyrin repeat protein
MPKRTEKLRNGAGSNLLTPNEVLMVTEAMIIEACTLGDLAQLRNWGQQGVRTCRRELGADYRYRDGLQGLIALHIASVSGNLDIVRCLLNVLDADISQEDRSGLTATLYAASTGQLGIMRCLVREFGADINHTGHNGETALMLAAECRHAALTKWLVKAGADPQARNSENETAADISRASGASPEQTAYLEAKVHCSQPGCSGAGTKKCQGCMQGRYCGPACHVAHWPAHRAECRRLGAMLKSAQEEGGE